MVKKAIADFNKKDWKNFSLLLVLVGLMVLFIAKQLVLGIGIVLVGVVLKFFLKGW